MSIDLLSIIVDPSSLDCLTPELLDPQEFASKAVEHEGGWKFYHELENALSSQVTADSGFCFSELPSNYSSSNFDSPVYQGSELSLNDGFIPAAELATQHVQQPAVPDDLVDFIETYTNSPSGSESTLPGNCYSKNDFHPESQWRKISSKLPPEPRLPCRRSVDKLTELQIPATKIVTAQVASAGMNRNRHRKEPLQDTASKAPYSVSFDTQSRQMKDSYRIERKRDSNRMSAHRYRSKMKALSEDVKQELADALTHYRQARSAYDKAVDSFDELQNLVRDILAAK